MLSQALGFVLFAPIVLSVFPTFTVFHIQFDAIIQLVHSDCTSLSCLCSPDFTYSTTQLQVNAPREYKLGPNRQPDTWRTGQYVAADVAGLALHTYK